MEPAYYLRILRLRWKVVALFGLVGAIAGLGFTALEGRDDGQQVEYWVANHKLIVSPSAIDQGRFPNLLQTALLVTGGSVPERVAGALDTDEPALTQRVRTVTDLQVNVVEISAVSLAADDAALVADAFADEFVTFLDERDNAAYENSLDEARSVVVAHSDRLEAVDVSILEIETEIELLENPPGGEDIEGLTDEEIAAARAIVSETIDTLSDELRPLRIERDTRLTLFEDALADLDDLERAGPPPPLLETLDVIAPFQISEKLYNLRLKQGGEGTNNFNITEVDDGSGGGLRLGDTVSNPVVRVGLGLLAGMLVGIGAVLMHLRFDPRLRTKAEIEEAFDLPVLAEIPKFSGRDTKANELHAVSRGRSIVTESYRMVRSALLFARAVTAAPLTTVTSSVTNGNADDAAPGNGDGPAAGAGHELRVVMVTSPGPSEGKTTTTANMAVVLAEAGYEVLVVNCDYRLPKLHEYFGQPHSARRTVDTGIPGVTLIADVADPEARNPTAVVESQRALIRKARERYDVVLLDTAPLLATNDALSLLPVVDIVVLVAREGKTDREAATETVDLLRRRRANLAGVVVTGSSGFGRSRYYYKYRYGNYYDHGDDPTSAPGGEAQAATRSARAVVTTN